MRAPAGRARLRADEIRAVVHLRTPGPPTKSLFVLLSLLGLLLFIRCYYVVPLLLVLLVIITVGRSRTPGPPYNT